MSCRNSRSRRRSSASSPPSSGIIVRPSGAFFGAGSGWCARAVALLLALCASPIHAQEQIPVSQADLDAALQVRWGCLELNKIINSLGTTWEQFADGEIDIKPFVNAFDAAKTRWRREVVRCGGSINSVPSGPMQDRLSDELSALRAVWLSLQYACSTRKKRADAATLRAAVEDYAGKLKDYERVLDANREFWDGEQVAGRRRGSCLDDNRRLIRDLRAGISAQMIRSPVERDAALIAELRSTREVILVELATCERALSVRKDLLEARALTRRLQCDDLAWLDHDRGEAPRNAMRCQQHEAEAFARCLKIEGDLPAECTE